MYSGTMLSNADKLADCIKRLADRMAVLHAIEMKCRKHDHPGCVTSTHQLARDIINLIEGKK